MAKARGEAGYQLANWRTEQGLPTNKIMAVAQTPDGYIWAGTYEGLVRFDGVTFTRFDDTSVPGWRDRAVTSLHVAANGALWIGHAHGAVSCYEGGRFREYAVPNGWPGRKVQGIRTDAGGAVWIQDDAGHVARLGGGRIHTPEPGVASGVYVLAGSKTGEVWVLNAGKLYRIQGDRLEEVRPAPGMDPYVCALAASRDGGFWVVAGERVWKFTRGQWTEIGVEIATGGAPIFMMIETSDGKLVGGTTDHGVVLLDPRHLAEGRLLWRRTGFPADWVLAVCEDHEGGLWIATGTAGLFRRRESNVENLLPPDAWQGRLVLSVSPARSGGLWVGTEGAGLYRWRNGEWTNYARDAGIRNPYLWSVVEDQDEQLWLGTWGGGVYVRDQEKFRRAAGIETLTTPVTAITPARAGGVWLGTAAGVMRYRSGEANWFGADGPTGARDVRALLEDPDGTVWAGTDGDGLLRIAAGQVAHYRRGDGLGSDFVQCLWRDAGGVLWIGTRGGGLTRFAAGRFATVGAREGLPDATICHIEEDGAGYLWMSSHGGIFRVARDELVACLEGRRARVTALAYGLSDGLFTLATSGGQPAGCRLPDGRLVFATDRGLAVIDPGAARPNTHAPPVAIESVRVGDRLVADRATPEQPIVIPPGEHRVEIRYTGLSFAAPERVTFRRRLEGLEPDWTAVGTERTAVYNFVPPGHYVFHVTAANNDGVWNERGRSLRFEILPFFWQTVWFRSVTVAGLMFATSGVVWMQTRRRMQRRLELLEREQAIQAERTRIAHDMHDDLGSHLTRISMLSETARGEIGDRSAVERRLDQIYDTARSITRAMDEIVWAVNPKHDTLESLVSYFEKFALDLLGTAGLRCRLDLPSEYPSWQPGSEVRHNLFLAYKEALNNAVRHAQADTVTVTMQLVPAGCTLEVRDNGRGCGGAGQRLEPRSATAGNGLVSMRRRMERIHGTFALADDPAGGCVVSLFVPHNAPGCVGQTAA